MSNERRTEVTDIQELNNRLWNNIDNIEAVKKLLQQEKKLANGEAPASAWWGWANWSFLAYAVYKENNELVNVLLDAGADPNQAIPSGSCKGYTLLTYAVCYHCDNYGKYYGNIIKALLNQGADPNQVVAGGYYTQYNGKSLLEITTQKQVMPVVNALLESKIDPDYKCSAKELIKIIIYNGSCEGVPSVEAEKAAVQLLKITINNYNADELQALLQTAVCGPRYQYEETRSYGSMNHSVDVHYTEFKDEISYVELLRFLRTRDQSNLLNVQQPLAEGRFKDWNMLAFAVFLERAELAEELLLMHAKPNQLFGHIAPATELKIETNWIGWSLLAFSVFNNRPKMVEVLLKYRATPTEKITQGKEFKEWSLISFAIYKRYAEVAQLLLHYDAIKTAAEADACFIDYYRQWTLLAWSVYYNQANVAQSLVEYGADPEQKFREGRYQGLELYDYALRYKQKEITIMLATATAIRNEKKKSLADIKALSDTVYELDRQLNENDKEIKSLKEKIIQLETSKKIDSNNSDDAKKHEGKELEELKDKLAKALAENDKWKHDFEVLNKQYLQAKIKNTNFKDQDTPPSTTQSAFSATSVSTSCGTEQQRQPCTNIPANSKNFFSSTQASTSSATTVGNSQNISNNRSGMFANQVNSSTTASTANQTNSSNEAKESKEEKAPSTSANNKNVAKSQTQPELKKICEDYWYEDDEMKRILEHEVKFNNNRSAQFFGAKDVSVLGPLDHNYSIAQALAIYNQNGKKPGIILIPYNLNRLHWVGVIVEYDAKKIIKANYYDSLEGPVPPVLNAELNLVSNNIGLVTAFTAITPQAGLIRQSKSNSSNCGPCTIENLLAGIGYREAKNTDSIGRRLRHLGILEHAGDMDFYNNFYQRQLQNISSFSAISGECHAKLARSNTEYNFSKSEYKWLLLLALDIIKLPNTIKLELLAAMQPGNSHEPEEHASQIDRIRVALNSSFTNSPVKAVINKFFFIKSNATSLEQALLRLNYNYIKPLSVLTSLSQTAINDDLIALEDNCSKTYSSHKCEVDPLSRPFLH